MSHQEYIAKCDEEQLAHLVGLANKRMAEIRVQGWIKLWVIGTEFRPDEAAELILRSKPRATEDAP